MLKKGDKAVIKCPGSKYDNVEVKLVSEPYFDEGDKLVDVMIVETKEMREACWYKYLQPVGKMTVGGDPPKPTWFDVSDMSELRNEQVHALASYAADGSCWEWVVMHSKGPAYIQSGKGRSIDRRTAKSDAESFIANYEPEDTSERDEIRRKLERSWHK